MRVGDTARVEPVSSDDGGTARRRSGGSGARYSDRYFGTAGRPSPGTGVAPASSTSRAGDDDFATGRRTDPDSTGVDSVGGPLPPDPVGTSQRTARAWYVHPVARLSLVAALVVGAVAGAYGWEQWRDRQVEIAARSTADVQSDVVMVGPGADWSSIVLSVRLFNEGTHPLILADVRAVDPRLTLAEAEFDPVEIGPDSSGQTLVTFEVDCDITQDTAEQPLLAADDQPGDGVVAQLFAVDGSEHEYDLPITGFGPDLGTFLTDQCGTVTNEPTFREAFPDIVAIEPLGADAVAATLLVSTWLGQEPAVPNIVAVEPSDLGFAVSWDSARVIERPTRGGVELTATWTVRDCAAALVATESGMALRITGQMPADDRTTTITAPAPADLVLELIRLAERTCR